MNARSRRVQSGVALVACIAVLVLCMGRAGAGQDLPVAAQGMPVCEEGKEPYLSWKIARDRVAGMTASSVDRFLIPTATASDDCDGAVDLSLNQSGRFDDGIHAWIAAARCKEVVCGKAHSLEPFCGGVFATGECDLNNNIFVADDAGPQAARVASLLERHQCLGDTVGLRPDLALEGGTLCFNKPPSRGWLLHAEATAPYGRARDALKAAWASQAEYRVWRSSVADQEMCVYGPIVGDTGHALKAEVHPVNMYWWTRRRPDGHFAFGGPYDLLLVQDASGRYGNEFGYVIRDPFPENRVWRAWSQAPLVGQFEIPVWVRDEDVLPGTCDSEARDPAPQSRQARQARQMREARGLPPTPGPSPVPTFRIQPWRACRDAPTITDEINPPPPPQCVSRRAPRLHVEVAAKNTAYEKFDVSADWACRCLPPLCPGPSHLGYLRVDGRVGLDRDFWEGAIGLTVVDTRLTPAVSLPACVEEAASRLSRAEAASPDVRGTIEARVRRILIKRNGREQEDLQPFPPASTLATLLAEVKWPTTLSPPPVEEIRRPKEVKLEVATRTVGLDEGAFQRLDIAKTWKVEVAPLPAAPEVWMTVVEGKRDDQVKVRTPSDRPHKIRATVDLTPNDSRVSKPASITQVLWTDRLALKASETVGWVETMSHICDTPLRSRAPEARGPSEATVKRLPAAVRNLLSEAGRRGEVTMTTLAILADLVNNECPAPVRPEERKMMLR